MRTATMLSVTVTTLCVFLASSSQIAFGATFNTLNIDKCWIQPTGTTPSFGALDQTEETSEGTGRELVLLIGVGTIVQSPEGVSATPHDTII